MGRGIAEALLFMLGVVAVSVPLAIWKLIDIGVWAFHHIRVG